MVLRTAIAGDATGKISICVLRHIKLNGHHSRKISYISNGHTFCVPSRRDPTVVTTRLVPATPPPGAGNDIFATLGYAYSKGATLLGGVSDHMIICPRCFSVQHTFVPDSIDVWSRVALYFI